MTRDSDKKQGTASSGKTISANLINLSPFSGNLFTDAAPPLEGERFDTILIHRNLVIERIVSSAVTAGQEYVQTQDEWVLLVQGEAVLQVAGQSILLKAGDHLFLPADVPHTVTRTSDGAMWLAVHLHP